MTETRGNNPQIKNGFLFGLAACLFLGSTAAAQPGWQQQESDHFTILYRQPHAYLVPHVLRSGEAALTRLRQIFDYTPSEKILVTTLDYSDFGGASVTNAAQPHPPRHRTSRARIREPALP